MLDQDSALALLTLAAEADATIALVGDRAQLPAVGRGGVLDIAAALVTGSGSTVEDLDTVHRFTDPAYARLTLELREGHGPHSLFDRLHGLGLVQLHTSDDSAHEQIATATAAAIEAGTPVAATVATNDEAATSTSGSATSSWQRGKWTTGPRSLVATAFPSASATSSPLAGTTAAWASPTGRSGLSSTSAATAPVSHRGRRCPPPPLGNAAGLIREQARHLAYAATGYGVQGVTTTTAHTLLSEALGAAGVYVGMTRPRLERPARRRR